jgi:hypothetical protein
MKRVLLTVAALGLTGTAALADQIDRREIRQLDRIEHGVQDGSLNRRETAQLLRGQEHVDRLERLAKSDGYVSPRERYRIWRAQNYQSRQIWRDRHDWN